MLTFTSYANIIWHFWLFLVLFSAWKHIMLPTYRHTFSVVLVSFNFINKRNLLETFVCFQVSWLTFKFLSWMTLISFSVVNIKHKFLYCVVSLDMHQTVMNNQFWNQCEIILLEPYKKLLKWVWINLRNFIRNFCSVLEIKIW